MLPSIKGPKFLKELKEFDSLVKAIGECKSKAEEDRIITQELELLKTRLNDPKLDKSRGREYMVRLLYCEMLGHDVSWAYIKALQFASEPNIFTKKAAYLCITQFFDHNHELVLLLVNTLLSDLKNDNFIIVCTALSVATRLIGPDLISAVYPIVVERLKHPKEHVRKKALIVLQRFSQLDPLRDGALAGIDLDRHFRSMLCDKDPSVMSATLCALYGLIKQDPRPYKNLIPSFTSILKQVSEHRLPKSYDYHRFPAPFIQIRLLKTLAALGEGDRNASENMYAVVHQTLRRATTSHTIGNALIYECVRTITTMFPNPSLLAAAAESTAPFLKSNNHNLRYVGIDALAGIVKINPTYAQEHQLAVLDCLEDPDDTLKLKTLELLYKMTKASNVEVIVEKMMGYLRLAADEHIRRDIVRKVSELAEKYAPTPQWFVTVMSEVFELGGEHVEVQLAHNLMRLVAEQDEDLHASAATTYAELLNKPKLPDVLLQVVVWVLGEYGTLATGPDGARFTPQQIMDKLATIPAFQKPSDMVRGMVLAALSKVVVQSGVPLTPAGASLASGCLSSRSTQLQQRAHELMALCRASRQVQSSVIPPDSSGEEFDEKEKAEIRSLSFLDGFVQNALRAGASPYLTEEQREGILMNGHSGDKGGQLKFEAYEVTAAPVPSASRPHALDHGSRSFGASSSGMPSSGSYSDLLHGISAPPAAAAASVAPPVHREPVLTLRNTGNQRWGPAQYTQPEPPKRTPSFTQQSMPAPVIQLDDHFGDLQLISSAPVSQPMISTPAPAPAPRPLTERERLAASIFGGGGGSAPAAAAGAPGSRSRPTGPGVGAPQAAQRQPPAMTNQAAAYAAARSQGQKSQSQSSIDLLLDFDAPASNTAAQPGTMNMYQAPSQPPQRNNVGLEVLLDRMPSRQMPMQVPQQYHPSSSMQNIMPMSGYGPPTQGPSMGPPPQMMAPRGPMPAAGPFPGPSGVRSGSSLQYAPFPGPLSTPATAPAPVRPQGGAQDPFIDLLG